MALVLERSVLIGFAFDAIQSGNLKFLRVLLGAKALASVDTEALPDQLSGYDLAKKITVLEANKSRTPDQNAELADFSRQLSDLTQRKTSELKQDLLNALGEFREMMPLPDSILAMVDDQGVSAQELAEAFLDPAAAIHTDTIDENGSTLLARSVAAYHPDIAKLLILAGADLDFISGDLPTPRQQMKDRTEPEWKTLVTTYASKISPKTVAIKNLEKNFVTRLNNLHAAEDNKWFKGAELTNALQNLKTAIDQIDKGIEPALTFKAVLDRFRELPGFFQNAPLVQLESMLRGEYNFFREKVVAATPKVAPTPRASAPLVVSAPAVTRSSGSASFIMGGEASALTMASVQAMVKKEAAALVETAVKEATAPLKQQLAALEAKNTELTDKLAKQGEAMTEVKAAVAEVREFTSLLQAARASGGFGRITVERGPAPAPAAPPTAAPANS